MEATAFSIEGVRGWLHEPTASPRGAMALFHGASSDANSPVLKQVADALAGLGVAVLRCDLPFRQSRGGGPPRPNEAARDREGIRQAAGALGERFSVPVYLGGHSYGGRQSTMAAAETPELAAGLLLLSYPLHPPGKSQQQRTEHFPMLRVPTLFAHGTRDPFGSVDELREALSLIPGRTELVVVERAGHELLKRTGDPAGALRIAEAFAALVV